MPPVMPYVHQVTGDASFYPPLRRKGRVERSIQAHRALVNPDNTVDDALRIANELLPLDCDNLATAIHKIAKLRKWENKQHEELSEDPRWIRLIDEVVETGFAFVWPMRLLSLVAWAVGSVRDRRILPLLFDICAKRVAVGAVPQDLSSVAWAVATSRMRDARLCQRISAETFKTIENFIPQDLAMTAWAFAKVQQRDGPLLRRIADEALARSSDLNGQNLSNIVWALATVREMHEELMDKISNTRCDQVDGLNHPQEFSNIVWSFATLPRPSERLFRRTAPRVVETARGLDSQHLANITWAYAKVAHRDDGLFHVLSREAMRSERPVNPLNLANLAWAFASAGWHGEMTTKRVGIRDPVFFKWIAETAVKLADNFKPQNCSNLIWAFATMKIGNQGLFETMSGHAASWIHDADPQHISNVLWSYAKLGIYSPVLFEAAADEIARRGLMALSTTPQNLSNVLWAYGQVGCRPPALVSLLEAHVTTHYYGKLTETRPLQKSNRAQIAMSVLALHRLGVTHLAWALFDRLAADGLQCGGEAYTSWLFICGDTDDKHRECDVLEQMAKTSHTRGLQAGCYNAFVLRCIAHGFLPRARQALQSMDEQTLVNPMSEHLRHRVGGVPTPRNPVGEIEWRRRTKEEHEWVTNELGFSLRLNKIEYYKEIGTLHYILREGQQNDVPKIHRAIESFIREQELWLKLAGDEKGAVLDSVIAAAREAGQDRPRLIVEVGLYVGYSSTRMASQIKAWGGKIISMEVDPYHAAIARNTIEWAGLTDVIEVWCGHSENLIHRLRRRFPDKSIDILFFDQRGTTMQDDLWKLENYNLLSDECILMGDNVLRPGAPQFMWWTCVAGPYETQVVSLKEYAQDVVEDWLSVSFHQPYSNPTREKPPESVEQLGHKTDTIRWTSIDQRVDMGEWDMHSQAVRKEFAKNGITPHEIYPVLDQHGRSTITLAPRNSRPVGCTAPGG